MLGLNVRRTSVLSALFVLFLFAAFVLPSSADGRMHISNISPSSAYPDDTVRVYGSDATPNAVVVAMLSASENESFIVRNGTSPWIIVGSSNLTLGSTIGGESGDWEIDFVTANVYPGHYSIFVFDNGSLTSDIISFRVLMNVTGVSIVPASNFTIITNGTIGSWPILFFGPGNAAPSSGPPGTFVTVSGHSVSGGEISVYFDNTKVATVVGQRSDWSTSFQVPSVSVGNHTIRAIDTAGRWMSVTPFYVTSSVLSFSMFSLSLVGLFAVAVFSGVMLLMLLVFFCTRRNRSTAAT